MPTTIQALREQRTEKARNFRNILDANPGELNDNVKSSLDDLEKDISALDESIAYHEKALTMAAKAQEIKEATAEKHGVSMDHAESIVNARKAVFNAWLRGGEAEARQVMAVTTDGLEIATPADGGYTVPEEVSSSILQEMALIGSMRKAATVLVTSTGRDINFPTTDETSAKGELLAERTKAAHSDPTFGSVELKAYKFSSKSIAVSYELLQDSAVDLEGFIRGVIVDRLTRITEDYYHDGTGSGEPKGALASATSGKTTASGNVTTCTWQELIDLVHSVDPVYRMGTKCGFMFNDTTLGVLRKLEDNYGRPLWMPSVRESEPDRLLGFPYYINQEMADMEASAKPVLFGDFSKFIIRDVSQIRFMRFDDSAYAAYGTVGFLAMMRSGSTLLAPSSSCLKYLTMASA